MRKSLLIVLGLLILSSPVWAATAAVTWVAPTHNEDGSLLTDLAGYQVYHAVEGQPYGAPTPTGLATSLIIAGLTEGTTYTFTVTAVDSSDNESDQATPVLYTIPLDTDPPTMGAPSIADGATGVSPLATFTATFSEAMNAATINLSTVRLRGPDNLNVPLLVSYNASTRVLTVNPTAPLRANTLYTLTMNGLTDVAGNPLAPVNIQFTTGPSTIPGLVLGYPLNASTGTVAVDVSGRNKHGTLINGVQWVQGVAGQAVWLDSLNDYVRVSSPQHPTGNWTWAVWIYPEAVSGKRGVMQIQTSASKGIELALSQGRLEVWYRGTRRIPPCATIPVSQWSHVTLIRQGSQLRLYVNGQQVASASGATTLNFGSCPLLLGVDVDSGCTGAKNGHYLGRVDDVRVYNRALTGAEITAVMTQPWHGSTQ